VEVLSIEHISYFFKTSMTPIPYFFWQAISNLFGHENIAAYRAMNILFHAFNGLLVYRLALAVGQIFLGKDKLSYFSFFSTFLFLFHPVQVESVVWLSSFRGIIATTFMLLAIESLSQALFSKESQSLSPEKTVIFLCLLSLGLLSKPTAVSMILLVPLIPLFEFAVSADKKKMQQKLSSLAPILISFSVLAVGIVLLHKGEVLTIQTTNLTIIQKLTLTTASLSSYILNLVLPFQLVFDYQINPFVLDYLREEKLDFVLRLLSPLGLMLSLSCLVIPGKKIYGAFALAFLCVLSPHIGLIFHDFQNISTVADRYLYSSLIPFAWLTSSIIVAIGEKLPFVKAHRRTNTLIGFLCAGVLLLNFRQVSLWRTPRVLLERSTTKDSLQAPILIALANHHLEQQHYKKAKELLREGLLREAYSQDALLNLIWINELIPLETDTYFIAQEIRKRTKEPYSNLMVPFARVLIRAKDYALAKKYLQLAQSKGIDARVVQPLLQKVNNFQDSEVTDALMRLADYYYVLGKFSLALSYVEESIKRFGSSQSLVEKQKLIKAQILKK